MPRPDPQTSRVALGRLRRDMEALGCSVQEIAREMQRTHRLRPREAYRHARGWSQEDAAAAYNSAEGSGTSPMSGARISAYERWPNSGERPSPRVLALLARAYQVSVSDLVDYEDLKATPAADRALLAELAPRTPESPGADATPVQPPAPRSGLALTEPERTALADSARQSADFAARAGQTNVSPYVLEQLEADLESIARRYLTEPLTTLVPDMLRVRNQAWELLEGRQHPTQSQTLYLVAGKACGLLASASCDLGQYDAADTHARTAWLCADLADHDKLRAWIANTRSSIDLWRGQHRRAAEHADTAAHYAGRGTELVRAHSHAARARARLGDAASTRASISAAVRARDDVDDAHAYPGMWAFPIENQQRCAGSALIWLGEPEDALIHLEDALAGYAEGSYAHLAVTQLDIVRARLHLGDYSGAHETILPVLELPTERRLAGVVRRAASIRRQLTAPALDRPTAGRALTEHVIDFLEHNAVRAALPSSATTP